MLLVFVIAAEGDHHPCLTDTDCLIFRYHVVKSAIGLPPNGFGTRRDPQSSLLVDLETFEPRRAKSTI